MIPEEIIRKGRINIYPDEDRELLNSVYLYNEHMSECRIKKHSAGIPVKIIMIAEPLLSLGLSALLQRAFFDNIVNILLMLILAAVYVYFILIHTNLWAVTAASVPFILISPVYIVLVAVNLLLTIIHCSIIYPLRAEQGYPMFNDIEIHFERYNKKTG